MRKYWGIPYRKASGNPQKAIDTLMENQRGFVPNVTNKQGIGKFDIPWGDSKSGLAHALERRAKQKNFYVTEFVNSLPDTINDGLVTPGSKLHPETKNIESLTSKIAISPELRNQKIKRNWMVTAIPQNKSARKRLEGWTLLPNISSKDSSLPPSSLELLANDSINDYFLKNNPAKWL